MRSSRPLRSTGTDLERLLLAAGSAEAPDAESVQRAAEALGLVPRALLFGGALVLAVRSLRWSSIATAAALPLAGLGAAGLVAHGAIPWGAGPARQGPPSLTAPVAAPTATGATCGEGPRHACPSQPARRQPARDGVSTVAPADSAGSAPVGMDSEATGAPAAQRRAPGPRRTARAVEPARALTVDAAASLDHLRAEATLVDRARARLTSGDEDGALAVLDDHDRRFAKGALSDESFLLRVEALAQRGDRAQAAALARRLLGTSPAGLHADRLRAILARVAP